jgi:hypothetical protein
MASQLAQNFLGIPVEELVPDSAAVRGVSRSSLLTGRRRVRLAPQTGASAGTWTSVTAGTSANGQIIQFVLADSSSLLDLNSVVLSCNAQTFGAAAGVAIDDGPAWMRRVTVSLNGTVIDDTDLANRFCNASVQAGSDRSYYAGAGSFAGFWATNNNMNLLSATAGGTTTGTNMSAYGDVSGALVGAGARYRNATPFQAGYPLALVSSLFRAKQYLPLSQCGELVIQVICAPPGEAVFQRTGQTDGGYALSDIFLEADFIQPHYLYQEMLNRVTQLEGEQGMVIAYDATISTQGQALTTSGTQSIVTSLATNNLRKIIVTFSPASYLTNINYPAASCFPNMNVSDVQWRIGSLYFPSQPANSIGRMWQGTASAFNGGNPLHHNNGCTDYNLWVKTTSPVSATYGNSLGNRGNVAQYFGDSCVIAYSFDCLKGGEELMADGISVLGQAGSQIVTAVTLDGTLITGGVVANIHLTRTRYLVLKNGSLRVEGV